MCPFHRWLHMHYTLFSCLRKRMPERGILRCAQQVRLRWWIRWNTLSDRYTLVSLRRCRRFLASLIFQNVLFLRYLAICWYWYFFLALPKDCKFPFEYNGNLYSACTTVGSTDGKAWCSTTTAFQDNWVSCDCKWNILLFITTIMQLSLNLLLCVTI